MSVAPADLACPRCGGSQEGNRFYGPCPACVDRLRALKPPKKWPAAWTRSTTAMNGRAVLEYCGPRTGR